MPTQQLSSALSDQHGAFAVTYARHHNASQAAREAGYAQGCACATGTCLLANAINVECVPELEAQTAVDLDMSRKRLLGESQDAAALAEEKREPMAMVAARREIAEIYGFYQPELVCVVVDLSRQGGLAQTDGMTDDELMAIISTVG